MQLALWRTHRQKYNLQIARAFSSKVLAGKKPSRNSLHLRVGPFLDSRAAPKPPKTFGGSFNLTLERRIQNDSTYSHADCQPTSNNSGHQMSGNSATLNSVNNGTRRLALCALISNILTEPLLPNARACSSPVRAGMFVRHPSKGLRLSQQCASAADWRGRHEKSISARSTNKRKIDV